jgi:Lrp/AsnC family leucine-responsive transcriptional regulator
MMARMIDGTDTTISMILQKNARTSNAEVARQVGLAPSAVFERIRRLEEKGVLRGFHANVDPHAAGLPLLAFVFVRSNERAGGVSTAEKIARIPEVLEVHHVAGEDCLLVKLRVADTEALGKVLRERIGSIATVSSTRTTIVLETVKESMALPLEASDESVDEAKRA